VKIIIKTKNLELTESLSEYIEKKLFSLKKFLDILKKDEQRKTLSEVFVDIEKETKHHRKGDIFLAEALINLPGKKIIAKAKQDDLYKSINEIKTELAKEIKKYKLKMTEIKRREQRKVKNIN
jgi:ribosomal subunit interface protein